MSKHFSRRAFVAAAAGAAAAPMMPRIARAESSVADALRFINTARAPIDDDLLEVTIAKLQSFYEAKKYTVTQVTRWYLDRIAKYDRVYRSILHVDSAGALATAAAQDAAAKAGGSSFKRSALWGVPIVIKANTSVKGLVTSAGWSGYLIPGLELVAPMDATVVAKLKAAGAVILGHTNMPDFAASDTNISSAFGRTGNAYNPRYSPGGSSGGTVTAVAANFCVFGTGTDTANSIRMPSGTSAVVGVLPTRGLVSIAGIHPLDWLLDNTGPIARNVADAATALTVMAGEDSRDFRTKGSGAQAESGPYSKYLNAGALKGKRFGIPTFIVRGGDGTPLQPETRELFNKAIDALRATGATVVADDGILPEGFSNFTRSVNTQPYVTQGAEDFLRDYGPPAYHSSTEYAAAVGTPMPGLVRGNGQPIRRIENDPSADDYVWQPQRAAVAAYDETLNRFQLDGFVYPALQMPPNDEVAMAVEGRRSSGPHSNTGWANPIGIPAVVVPGGFYPNGLPFGIEFSTRRWKDGDLLGWAYAYEQATKFRKPPALREKR
jgi:Asp-tRNA(Asn)/Glu-tRNA(Gln) amidotransferase A subunit family amidase